MQHYHKLWSLLAVLVLLVTALPLATAQPAAATDKIEGALRDRLATEGAADFVVRFAAQADLAPAYSMDWEARGVFVYNTLQRTARQSQAAAIAYLDGRGLKHQTFIVGNELYVWAGDLDAATDLAALPEVALVRATRTYYIDPVLAAETPQGADTLDWGIIDTAADQFWAAFGMQGDGVVVSNIDTGVQWNHPALDQAFKCGSNPSDPACWADPSNICGGSACDNNGHGTHTMGTMVGDDDPGLTYQVGMAPDAQWIACKGCESNSCSDYALNTCADWILAPGGSPNNRPHVVNNSWGGGGCDDWYLAKVQAWRAAGTFPAFSAGNSGSGCNSLGSPGDYQESFGSAAHDVSRNIASFSSRGPSCYGHDPYTKPNISAPGVNVCSSVPTNGWNCGYSGTSMASPHSAGAVALLWSCNPGLIGQIDQTFEILQDNADPPPPGNCGAPPDGEGNYTYGYGYLNVYNAGLLWCGATGWLDGHVTEGTLAAPGDPIVGATITAVKTGFPPATATTDAQGYYTKTLTVGLYDVTASAYGYLPETVAGVLIVTDTVTTQDFALVPAASYVVDGYVTDATTGWPLYARIDIAGYPYSPIWTDPVSGYYNVTLAGGIVYTFDVSAWVSGYVPESRDVGPLTGPQTEDFALVADADSCSAPGYHPECFFFEGFEGGDGGFTVGGVNSTWAWGMPTSGPGEAHGGSNVWATNLAGDYNDDEDSYIESPDIDLSALAGQGVYFSWWQWLQTESCCDYGQVLVSNDGGGSWTSVYGPARGDVDLEWTRHAVILDSSYAVSNFRVRYYLYTDYSVTYPGFYVDDICIVPVAPPVEVFADDFESGYGNWTMDGLWNAEAEGDTCGSYVAPFPSSSHAAYYGDDTICSYDVGYSTGALALDVDVDLTTAAYALLRFASYEATECYGGNCGYDERYVLVSTDGGGSWTPVWGSDGPEYEWYDEAVDLSAFVGEQVRVAFVFDTGDDAVNDYFGWMVDDVQIVAGAGGAVIPCVPSPGGLVVGNVYDENLTEPLVGALVVNEAGYKMIAQPTPDDPAVDDAFYTLFSPPADNAFTATMRGGYLPDVEVVTVVPSDTVRQDFYLPAGWLLVEPMSLAATVDWGLAATLPLSLTNAGGYLLNWEYGERDRGWRPLLRGGYGEWLYQAEQGVPLRNNRGEVALAYPKAYRWHPANGTSQLNVLVYGDDVIHTAPNTFPDQALQYLGLPYTAYYDGDWGGFEAALGSGTWDMVLVANDNWGPPASVWAALNNYVLAGGKLVYHGWTIGDDPGNALWSTLGFSYQGDDGDPPDPVYWWEPGHPVFNVPESVPEFTALDGGIYGIYGQYVEPLAGFAALAGYTTPGPDPNQAALVLGNDNRTVFKGFLDGQNSADLDGDALPDGVELWVNLVTGLEMGFSVDVPWLFEEPVSGTLAAGAGLVTDITMDSAYVNQPGEYYATLNVRNDTPYDTPKVFVTMTVLPSADMGKVRGTITDRCTGDPVKAAVTFTGGVPITQTTSDPNTGYYVAWLFADTYPVAFTADGYLAYATTVEVVAGTTTTLDVVLVPDRPCLVAHPLAYEVWVLTGTQRLRAQTIADIGGQDLLYEYREVPGGYVPMHAGALIVGTIPAERPANPLVFTGVAPAGYVPPVQQAPVVINGPWEARADSPFVSMDNVFVEYDGLGYLVGGYGSGGAVGIYDPTTDSWTTGATEPAPQIEYAVDGCFGFNDGGDPVIVLFNDTTSGATTLHRYNIATDSWDTPPVPSGFPSNGLWAADILSLWKFTGENVCYISGGATAPGGGNTSALYAYYPDTNTAVNLGNFTHHPAGFDFHASWYMPEIGAVCVGGGVDSSGGVFPDTQCYDLAGGVFNPPNADLGPMLEGVWGTADGFLYEGGDFQLWVANGADAGFALWQRSMYYSTADASWHYGPDPLYGVYRVEGTNVPDATGCHFYVSTGSTGGFSPSSYLERNFSAECPVFAKVDVPWLWEDPVSGTVPVDTSTDVEIGFTSYYTEVPTGTVVHLPYGTYTATLRLKNNDPVAGTRKIPVTMHIVDQYLPPEASFEVQTPVCADKVTVFTNTTSGGVPPAEFYLWDFGDGITSTLENPQHTYTAAGSYTVTLEACNIEDLCDTFQAVIEVLPGPEADFSFVVAGLTVTFTNLSQNADAYLWHFGDGGTSTETNPAHTYAAAGTYTVTLEATGDCGTDTFEAVVTVCAPVQIAAVEPVAAGCVVTFTADLTGTAPFTYLWAFGDGMTSTLAMPVHTYAASGVYNGTLEAWNCGGHDTFDFQVTVSCGYTLYLPLLFKAP